MKLKRIIWIATPMAVAGAAAAMGGHLWAIAHERAYSGRPNLHFVSCDYCHGTRLSRMPWAQPRRHHSAPGGMVVSPDGNRLFIALDDMNQIAVADIASRRVERRVNVPGGPIGLAIDPSGLRLFAACRDQDRVAVFDTRDFAELASVQVGVRPTDVAYCRTSSGERLVVANSGSDDVSVLSLSPVRELARPSAGREPDAVTISADGRRAYIANCLADPGSPNGTPASQITVLDPATAHVVDRLLLPSAGMSEAIATVPDKAWTLVPLMKMRNLVPTTQVASGWVGSSGMAVAQSNGEVTEIPLDEANAYFCDPSGVVADRGGHRAFVGSGGADVVTVVNLDWVSKWLVHADPAARDDAIDNLALSCRYVVSRIPTGCNPRHLALSPDGRTLFVAERLDDAVLLVDTETLKPSGRIVLGDGGRNDPIRRGERVFVDGRYAFQAQFSCRSCHPNGGTDGLAFNFDIAGIGRNFVENRSLCGVAGTEPLNWTGNHSSLPEQDGPGFARVLTRTDPIPPRECKEMATFLYHLAPLRTTPWDRLGKPLTPAQERGKEIFFATTRPDGAPIPRADQCATCHRPPLFTDHMRSDVGTQGPEDTTAAFDSPHLLSLVATAPYLHDGRARTLEELWTTYQKDDRHGLSSFWSKEQLNDLVEYLKTL